MEKIQLHYLLFNAHPSTNPPFSVELGFSVNNLVKIDDCKHIPDAIEKAKEYCKNNSADFAEDFTLLYPIYLDAMDSDFENAMHSIAWLIKEQADTNNWDFDRIGGFTGNTIDSFLPK